MADATADGPSGKVVIRNIGTSPSVTTTLIVRRSTAPPPADR